MRGLDPLIRAKDLFPASGVASPPITHRQTGRNPSGETAGPFASDAVSFVHRILRRAHSLQGTV
jgi:hypothetical protein